MPPRLMLKGKTFGDLFVLQEQGRDLHGAIMWLCQCKCGKQTTVRGSQLKAGVVRSCGCGISSATKERQTTHGMSGTPLYLRWRAMRTRCEDKNFSDYHNYGGRGITVCERWLKFENFMEDMGNSFSEYLELERVDVDGDYSPDNCAWVTRKEQQRNKRVNHRLTHDGETLTIIEWEERTGIKANTILTRIRRGWSSSRALSEPVNNNQPN